MQYIDDFQSEAISDHEEIEIEVITPSHFDNLLGLKSKIEVPETPILMTKNPKYVP